MYPLPFSQLPGMNALFLDFSEEPQKVQRYYPSANAVRRVTLSHRNELCQILKQQNRVFGNPSTDVLLEKLAKPETLCVITGQQTGLLTGPMYTLWKALTMLRYARQMEQEGIPCVPVFWMATEDHNWHEVLNIGLLRQDLELHRYSLKEHLFLSKQPTGSISVHHEEVRKILLRVFRDFPLREPKEFYSHGTLSEAFARTLLWLLQGQEFLLVDPSDPELKRLAGPFFQCFFDRSEQMMKVLSEQNERLREENYPVQVRMEETALPLFRIENGERISVPRNGSRDVPPEVLSPAALLRPLFQDFIFPTLAYIGGPAEIAYFAQLHPWYAVMEMEQPRLIARASLTLLPAVTRGFLRSRNLKPEEIYIKEETLMDALIHDNKLDELKDKIQALQTHLKQNLTAIKSTAASVEPTLKKAFETSERKIHYQVGKMERKALLAIRRKNDVLVQQIRKARNVIYPDEKLQERCLNIFWVSSKLPDLLQDIYSKIDLEAKGHQWIEI